MSVEGMLRELGYSVCVKANPADIRTYNGTAQTDFYNVDGKCLLCSSN